MKLTGMIAFCLVLTLGAATVRAEGETSEPEVKASTPLAPLSTGRLTLASRNVDATATPQLERGGLLAGSAEKGGRP